MGDAAATAFGFLDPGWVWAQLSGGNPVPFLSWTAAMLLAGICAGMAARNRRLDRRIRTELGTKPGLERVNTVDRLIDKADELSERPTREELAELRGEVEALRASLDVAEKNASATLFEAGEDLEEVRFVQSLLSLLYESRSAESIRRIADERVNGGSEEDNLRYGRAFEALARYGCLRGVMCLPNASDARYIAHVSDRAEVSRRDLPSLSERMRVDLVIELEGMMDEKIRKQSKRCFG